MGIDQTGQDELARGLDHRIIRGLWPNRASGIADMDYPVSLDNNECIRDRVAPRSVNQCPVLDQQPRRGIRHYSPSLYDRSQG
jgi:hypothetical protein